MRIVEGKHNMEDASDPFLPRHLVNQTEEGGGGHASQLFQCTLVAVTRAFDAQQCFITAFADSTSYPSNILTEWSLQDASPLLTSLPSAAFFAGSFAGGFVIPLADSRLGRKNLLLIALLLMSLSSLLTSFSPNLFVYSAFRFASGFGRAPIGTSALVLSTEIVGPTWRAHIGILGFVLVSFGFASLPAIAFLNRHSSWRRLYLWTSLPALLYSVVIYFLVKESPRWMRLKRTTTADTYYAIRALVSSKWAARRLALGSVLTFGLGCATFGMPLGLGSLSFNLYISVAMEALIKLPSALAAFCLIGTVNRRSSLIATTALSGICSIACGAMGGSGWGPVALELAGYLIASTAYDIGLIYVSELFPTCVRNSAVAIARQTMVLGAVVGSVLAEMGDSWKNELISYGGFGAVILVCGLFVLWLPETRGSESCDTMEEEESNKTPELVV